MTGTQVATKAADLLRDKVLDGTFAPGSRLPSERELSAQLGISRTALRDALQNLKATGLLEAQVGRGWFVTADRSLERSTAAAMNWLALHRQDLESLNEVRQLLEPRAAQTMPKQRAADVAVRAAAIVESQARALAAGDLQAAAKLDGDFHAALVAATPNEPLRVLAEQLISLARVHGLAVYEVPGAGEHSLREHRAIVEALAAADLELASRLLRKHSRSGSRFALSRLAGELGPEAG